MNSVFNLGKPFAASFLAAAGALSLSALLLAVAIVPGSPQLPLIAGVLA
ncbi:MAG: hypothetical protein AAF707_04340 [Pseudomonadota bacterium]